MSGSGNRLNVVPTVSVLAVMKSRLSGAVKGHSLLKKKADALTMRFRQILKTIVQTKEEMGKKFRQSAFALTEAKYAAGDFRHTVLDNVEQASVKVRCSSDCSMCICWSIRSLWRDGQQPYLIICSKRPHRLVSMHVEPSSF